MNKITIMFVSQKANESLNPNQKAKRTNILKYIPDY